MTSPPECQSHVAVGSQLGGGEGVHLLGERNVLARHAARVVCRQDDVHLVVDVEPLGVMIRLEESIKRACG